MVLQNEYMRVEISPMGAELMSIYDLREETELLWNGDPAYWKRRAPVLFPNVGKTYENKVLIDGCVYPTSQHGFARDSEFICEKADESHAVFRLSSNDESLAIYPFEFSLRICYALNGRKLEVKWIVNNESQKKMPFTIGGHPAFCFAGAGEKKEDYALEFPGKKELIYVLLDLQSGTALPHEKRVLSLENGMLALSDDMFARDALIFDGGQVEEAWLCYRDGRRRVGMRTPGFSNYGVWSVQGAPFVCLEPWAGRCDNCGFADELKNKPDVNILQPGCRFEKGYSIVLP